MPNRRTDRPWFHESCHTSLCRSSPGATGLILIVLRFRLQGRLRALGYAELGRSRTRISVNLVGIGDQRPLRQKLIYTIFCQPTEIFFYATILAAVKTDDRHPPA